jgi:hypothetical protein
LNDPDVNRSFILPESSKMTTIARAVATREAARLELR